MRFHINYVSECNMQIWLLEKVFLFFFKLAKDGNKLSWLVKKTFFPKMEFPKQKKLI